MKDIGDTIKYTVNGEEFSGVVDGRNWCFEHLLSYLVTHDGITIPVDPDSFKCQILA